MPQENQNPNLPDLAVQAEMAQQAYEYRAAIIEKFKNNLIGGVWRYESNTLDTEFADLKLSTNGYFAVVYRNTETKQIIISSRGTDPSNFVGGDHFNDASNDVILAFDRNPAQLVDALTFTKKIADLNGILMSEINHNGHSLGGFDAVMSAIMTGSSATGFNNPGVKEVVGYLKNNPVVLQNMLSLNEYLKSDPTLLSQFQYNLNHINENNFTNVNAVGDVVSDVNTQIGNVIELPVSVSGSSFLIGLLSGVATANPIVGVSVFFGSTAILEKHSMDMMVDALKKINSGEQPDINKFDGTIFSIKYTDGTSKQILFISKDQLDQLETKYNFTIKPTDILTTSNDKFLLVDSNSKITAGGEEHTISELVKLSYQENYTIQKFLIDTVESITKPLTELYDNPALLAEIEGEFLGRIIIGDSIEQIAKDLSAKLAATIIADKGEAWLEGKTGIDFQNQDQNPNQISSTEFLAGTIKAGLITFGTTIAIRASQHETLHAEDYANAALVATTSAAANQINFINFGFKTSPVIDSHGNPINGTDGQASFVNAANAGIAAAIVSLTASLANEASMNSEEYENAAKQAMVAAVITAITTAITATIMSVIPVLGTAAGIAVGTAIGIVVGTVISKLGGVAIYNYIDHSWDNSKEVYDVWEDLYLKGEFANSKELKENLKQLAKAIEDQAKTMTIDLIKDLGESITDTLLGGYGRSYGVGEYPNPIASLNITAKPDGTGNVIQGINPEGVVAIAREYYHDDLYGTSGSDNLVGKSGTNTIVGYDGNDHIEGRGDIDLLIGGKGDDEIFGGNGDDQIYGSEGSDNLFGGNGNDQIVGGEGNDFIQGGNGNDQIMGEAGNDTIEGNAGNDTILGGTGNDQISGNEGDDSILGEDGDDSILGGDGSDIIDGGTGTDYIEGNDGNDNIRGGDGNDEIYGGQGVDIIYGDSGNDLINSGSENDLAFGGLGNDIIYGGDGDDTLSGELGNDYVIGADGNDTLDGGADDDVLMGGIGNDIITTGTGNDTIIFRTGDGQDTITDTDITGSDTLKLSEINSKLPDNITNRVVLTKAGNNLLIQIKNDLGAITGDQIVITNQFSGGEKLKKIEFADNKAIDLTAVTVNGDNTISYTTSNYSNIDTSIQEELALGYNDQMQVIEDHINPASTYDATNYSSTGEQDTIDYEKYNEVQWRSHKEKRSVFGGYYTVWTKYYEQNIGGTGGNDRLVGHWWSENVYGGAGDDQLHGGDGNDNLFGGTGNDILHGGAGDDTAFGQEGEDLIYGGSGNDILDGGTNNDTVYGNEGRDTIIDNNGDNKIYGNGGSDLITTDAGNDYIEGNDDNDIINAGDGNNLIYGNGGNDVITAGTGNDTIYGQEGNDQINSGAGDDYISGGSGDDILNGENGNDTIFGDLGIDQINGGSGIDYIYGGAGADVINGDSGNDQIKGGDSDDLINGGADNDKLYGDSGSDKIYGDSGNDEIYGGTGGDVLDGNDGNDIILGGSGNDILVDGAGSDTLDGGTDSDIIILTKETGASTSIDTVKNFSITEDKIILKVNYQTPISFADIQSGMVQNGLNTEISLNNGQKIIIENTNIAGITAANFQIGLSGGAGNDILFGTNGEDIIFGDEANDKIYGGDGNDQLWGGAGSDELYGEGGDDILRYEADGKYSGSGTTSYEKEDVWFHNRAWTWYGEYHYITFYFDADGNQLGNEPHAGDFIPGDKILADSDVFIAGGNIISTIQTYTNRLIYDDGFGGRSRVNLGDTESFQANGGYFTSNRYNDTIGRIYESGYETDISSVFKTKNFYNNQLIDITGLNRTFDKFIGGSGVNTILMTEGNDILTLDDQTSDSGSDAAGTSTSARVQDISVIHAGSGDDIINFSTSKYSYGDLIAYGGTGNDKIWSSSGNDQIFGGDGDDEIYSGLGNDNLVGGNGNDIIYAGSGNDTLEGGSGTNQLFGENGDDTFIAGTGSDTIDGGNGSDTISYVNSGAAVNINLATNSFSGGDAANDTVSNVENITGSAGSDTLTGNSSSNTLNGGSGNDSLLGGTGSDNYIYNPGSGTDTITESGSATATDNIDYIQFGAGITASDLTFTINGNDLHIQVGASAGDKVIIKDQMLGTNRIEYLKFNNGTQIGALSIASLSENSGQNSVAISEKFFITKEDEELVINNPLDESQGERRRFESFNALYGSLLFDETLGQFTYKGNSNFHGIDEITIAEDNGTQNKFTIFVNGVNDTPIGDVPSSEIKVEEEFSVNLKDYFSDADGDALNLSLKLKGFDTLPDWINFNSETGIVSGKIGRDGKLNFTVTATDPFGASFSDDFHIKITRDIFNDIIPTTPVVQMNGTDGADILTATPNSSDIISGGDGDDVINYTRDNDWQQSGNSFYVAWNVYSGDKIEVTGKVRSYDAFDGGNGYDKLNLTDQNDVIFLDDALVSNVGDIAKLNSIEEINTGDGDDIADMTSLSFNYDDILINGGRGNDVLWGNDGNDTLNGDEGDDNLQGGRGDDILNGGTGNDIIKGYDGNDKITGGKGFDFMIGGAGNDQFIFTDKSDSADYFSGKETDIILDFIKSQDKIDLVALGFDSITEGQNSNSSAHGLEFYFDKDHNTIIDDPNSNFAVKLAGEIHLDHNDFNF